MEVFLYIPFIIAIAIVIYKAVFLSDNTKVTTRDDSEMPNQFSSDQLIRDQQLISDQQHLLNQSVVEQQLFQDLAQNQITTDQIPYDLNTSPDQTRSE